MIASQRVDASGLLRLNAPLSFGVRYVAPLIPAFSGKHPGVAVDLGLNDRVVDLMDEGWDLTIRVGRLKDSRLVSRKLAESAMIVCAAPSYWAARGRPKLWAELRDHNCLGSPVCGPLRPCASPRTAGRVAKLDIVGSEGKTPTLIEASLPIQALTIASTRLYAVMSDQIAVAAFGTEPKLKLMEGINLAPSGAKLAWSGRGDEILFADEEQIGCGRL
jgi:DNA-binding transcriptional LysR family regulator